MSAEVYPPSGNNASFFSSTVGGRKPLHRFIRGQPKSTGVRHTITHTLLISVYPMLAKQRLLSSRNNIVCGFYLQIVVLILGCSFFIVSMVATPGSIHTWLTTPLGLMLGSLVGWQNNSHSLIIVTLNQWRLVLIKVDIC